MPFVEAVNVNDLAEGQMVGFEVDGQRILLATSRREIDATHDTETRAQVLQQQRDSIREQQHPQQRVAEARAALDVCRPIAGIHVPDAHQERRA